MTRKFEAYSRNDLVAKDCFDYCPEASTSYILVFQ